MADFLPFYQGDENLGLTDTGIPVMTNKDLDLINQTSRDIYVNNIARNQQLFNQKLKDRDQLLAAIDSGDIKVGDLLEQDEPLVKEGLEKLDEAFANRIKKGINDIDALREYNKAKRDAQDRVTQAQGRKVFYDTESVAASKETLPRKQEARKKNLDGVIKGGFWKDITPYQQTQDLDIAGSILSTAANVEEQFTDPKTFTKGKRTVFDFDKTKLANQDNFLNDVNKRHDQQQLLQSVQELEPPQFVETVKAMNARIQEYNDLKGLKPGQPGFVDPLKVQIVNSRPVIGESLPDFAAKYTLAHQKPFSATETAFDKDRANFELGKERNRIAASNAAANQMRAKAYTDLQRKKLSNMTDDEKRVKGFWDGVIERVGEFKGVEDVIWRGNLPEGYTFMAGVDAKGQPIKLKPKVRKDSAGRDAEFYDTRLNNAATGEQVGKDFIKEKYDLFKKAGGAGDYNSYLRQLIKQGVLDLELMGQNGTADFNTALQSARSVSNKVGSGKEEPVFSETEEVTIED